MKFNFYEEFLLNQKYNIPLEENIFKLVNKYHIKVLENTPNWDYICDFLTEDVLRDFVVDTLYKCRLPEIFTEYTVNYLVTQVFSNIQYAGLPKSWENYYLNK